MELADAFVGRLSELQTITEMIALLQPGCVLISAPSGTGKSRLAREALAQAASKGFRTATARGGVVTRRVPLGALAEARELGLADQSSTLTPVELADRCAASLRAASNPLVLLVDDAHLLDDMSLLVIERLAPSDHVFLILTARTGEDQFDALTEMGTRGSWLSLPLESLGQEDTQALVERSLAGDVDPELVRTLFEHSQGNPLFVLELLRGSLESDRLTRTRGVWQLRGSLDASARVREVVESRLRGLGAGEKALVELLAFVDGMSREAVEHFSSLGTLMVLESRGLITTTLDQRRLRVALAHPIYGDVLRSRMSGLRTQITTQTLAEYLESQPDLSDAGCLQLAALRLICGGGTASIMRRAAQTALTRHDLTLALDCATVAVELGGSVEDRLLRARVLSQRGEFEEADAEIVGCLDLPITEEQLAEAAVRRLDFLTFYQGNVKDAVAFAADVETRIVDPALRDNVAVRRIGALLHTDGPNAVADAVEPLLANGSTAVESWACMLASWAYLRLGRFGDAYATSQRGEAAQGAHTYSTDWYDELHRVVRCFAEAGAGQIDSACATAITGLRQAAGEHALEAVGGYSLFLASLVRDRGHTDDALRHAATAVSTYRTLGRSIYLADAIVHRAAALAMAGRADEALEALDELDRLGVPGYWYFSPELHQARAWASAAKGLRAQAKDHFLRSASIGTQAGDLIGALTAWHGCARIGFARSAVEPMKRIVRQTDSALARVCLRHTVGIATRDARSLQAACDEFEALGADLLAGEAASACSHVLEKQGQRRAAGNAERRATAIYRRQAGGLAKILRPDSAGDLTAAESDTARLAAEGRSNAEIADLLGLSIRTVENRLQRVYVKVGISSRQALATLFE